MSDIGQKETGFMSQAIKEAYIALRLMEVPVGAVIVKDGEIIGRGHNLKETMNNVTAHAEIIAINEASEKLNAWRLTDCDMYVTLEPCPMCLSAIAQARIKNLYIGAKDFTSGACGSAIELLKAEKLYYKTNAIWVDNEECKEVLQEFFKELRLKRKNAAQE